MKQPRSYDCIAQDWIDSAVHGHDQKYNDRGHYGERMYVGNNGQIFSYGSHFEMARVITNRKGEPQLILINGERTSNTTTKHQGYVRGAAERSGLPSVAIPYGALEAAGVIFDSIRIVSVDRDKEIITHHKSESAPRRYTYVSGPTYVHGEWDADQIQRWNDWQDWSDHQKKIDDLIRRIGWIEDGVQDGVHAVWGSASDKRTEIECLKIAGPFKLGKDNGMQDDGSIIHRTTPPPRMIPTGNIVSGYTSESKNYVHMYGTTGDDNASYSFLRDDLPFVEPDADGIWRWTTKRHILGESVIEADVRTRRRTTCTECNGGRYRSGHQATPPDSWWSYGEYVVSRRRVPIPFVGRASINESDYRRDRNKWDDYDSMHMGVFPLPERFYFCSRCNGTGKMMTDSRRKGVKFLSGFDHGEPHLAYFFCELPKCDVSSVDEAYEALKPDTVKLAESMGRRVKRQGDIFAVETTETTRSLKERAKTVGIRHRGRCARELGCEPIAYRIYRDEAPRWNRGSKIVKLDKPEPIYSREDQARIDRMVEASMLLQTNHQGTEVITTKDGTIYAKGCLNHVPDGRTNDHVRVKLDGGGWWIIVKNTCPVRRTR